jgi:hypothetical protein
MNLDAGLWRQTWTLSRATSSEGSSFSSTSVRSDARNSAINNAAGLPLPATSPSEHNASVGLRQDVINRRQQ